MVQCWCKDLYRSRDLTWRKSFWNFCITPLYNSSFSLHREWVELFYWPSSHPSHCLLGDPRLIRAMAMRWPRLLTERDGCSGKEKKKKRWFHHRVDKVRLLCSAAALATDCWLICIADCIDLRGPGWLSRLTLSWTQHNPWLLAQYVAHPFINMGAPVHLATGHNISGSFKWSQSVTAIAVINRVLASQWHLFSSVWLFASAVTLWLLRVRSFLINTKQDDILSDYIHKV